MFTKLAKHRKFDYTPRVYNPKKNEGARPRIEFSRMHSKKKSRSFIWLIFLLLFVVYLIILLSKFGNNY
jgi:hypothetical protein